MICIWAKWKNGSWENGKMDGTRYASGGRKHKDPQKQAEMQKWTLATGYRDVVKIHKISGIEMMPQEERHLISVFGKVWEQEGNFAEYHWKAMYQKDRSVSTRRILAVQGAIMCYLWFDCPEEKDINERTVNRWSIQICIGVGGKNC